MPGHNETVLAQIVHVGPDGEELLVVVIVEAVEVPVDVGFVERSWPKGGLPPREEPAT